MRLPVARTAGSAGLSRNVRSSAVAGPAPLAPEITAQSGRTAGKVVHRLARVAVTAPGLRFERALTTAASRASGFAPRARAWSLASSTRNDPIEPSANPGWAARSHTG